MNRPSYKELLFYERKDREEQLRWIKDAVNGSAKFYREPPYSYEEELAREIMQLHTRIAELERDVKWREESIRTTEHALANNEDDIEMLESRIAELEAVIEILEDQQREAKNILIDKKLHIDSLYEEGYKLQQRIAELEEENDRLQFWYAELEAENDQLIAHDATERQDDKWIPVSKRLPDNWKSVLTIDISKSTRDMVTAFYNPETSLWSTHFSCDLWVTHWMPLPEPPIVYGKVCEE